MFIPAKCGFMPCRAGMNIPFPLKSTGPPGVKICPSTLQRDQNLCIILPQGFLGSVPKYVVPSLPRTCPGHACVNFKSTMCLWSDEDLMTALLPSSLIVTEDPSAEKLSLSSGKEMLERFVELHMCGLLGSCEKIFDVNCAVVRTPLSLSST